MNWDSFRFIDLFAGIGGIRLGFESAGGHCVFSSEFDENACKTYEANFGEHPSGDITKIEAKDIPDFDILLGGFPCQAFSHAAHGKNIAEKNLWGEMFRFVQESNAPIVFGENVTLKAIDKAKVDLESLGYRVERCKLSCGDLGADHRRDRYWLLAVRDKSIFEKVSKHLTKLPRLNLQYWSQTPEQVGEEVIVVNRRAQLKAIGNAQSPMVAASAFRILVNRHLTNKYHGVLALKEEIDAVYESKKTWIKQTFGEQFGYVHTPTTMANYSAPSMMKHQGCRNFVTVFGKPTPHNAEYLMGFPIGASSLTPLNTNNIEKWID